MLSKNKSSFVFGGASTYQGGIPVDINPEDLSKSERSYVFVDPIGGGTGGGTITDYVPKSIGGTFDALIGYTTQLAIVGNTTLTTKKYVDDSVASAIGGDIDWTQARLQVSSFAGTPLTYSSATGIFTLNKALSNYTNDAGFITDYVVTEADVTAHEAAITITTSQISDFSSGLSSSFDTLFDARIAIKSIADLGTKSHLSLTNLPGHSDGYHISSVINAIITVPATTAQSGYLTAADWNIFNGKMDSLVGDETTVTISGGIISTIDGGIDHNSLLNYTVANHRSINDAGVANTDLWSADKIISYLTDANITFTDITTNNASVTKHGFLPKLANDTGKYLRSDGAWITIPATGDFLDSVIRMVVDNGFDPGAVPVDGDRYIIMNSGSIHANFGTIDKKLNGDALALGSNDLVQYVTSAGEFRIVYDSSTATAPATVAVGIDKNGDAGYDWSYNITDDVWVIRGNSAGNLHNSLADLNSGIGDYYHWDGTALGSDISYTGNASVTGTFTGSQLISNIADGTAPLIITSTTVVSNLNVSLLSGAALETTLTDSDTKISSSKAVKTYADGKVADSITDGVTTVAPSQNAVFDALALLQIGGSDTYVQFNDGGVLGGDSGLVFNKSTNNLTSLGVIKGSNIETNATTFSSKLGISAGFTENQGAARYNTFVGYESGYLTSTGSENTFSGYQAGYTNSTGTNNTAIGYKAGLLTSTQSYSTYLGSLSGFNSRANSNTFVGYYSGYTNTTGSENSFFGVSSGTTNLSGIKNTFLGVGAGYYNSTGSSNVAIGYYAGARETASNKFFIDNQDRTTEALGRTNSLIYGVFNATPASQELYLNSKVYVTQLTSATKADVVYYDSSTKELSYGAAPAEGFSKLATFYTSASTSGTGLTTLYSYTVPANTLLADGDIIEAQYVISSTVVGTFTITFGGNSFTSFEQDFSSTSPCTIKITMIRASSSIVRVIISGLYANTTISQNYYAWTGYTFSNTNALILKATSPYAGVITAVSGHVIKF